MLGWTWPRYLGWAVKGPAWLGWVVWQPNNFFLLFYMLGWTRLSYLGWVGTSPAPWPCLIISSNACRTQWPGGEEEEKGEDALPSWRRRVASGVLDGVKKSNVWLVAATTVEAHRRKRGKRWKKSNINKNQGELVFLSLWPSILPLQCIKSTPIYRRRKRDILSLLGTNIGHWFSLERS